MPVKKVTILYKLFGNEDCPFETGILPDKHQVIIGLLCPEIIAIIFSEKGKFLEVQKKEIVIPRRPNGVYDIYHPSIKPEIEKVKNDMQLTAGPIMIQKFFRRELSVGIRDMPDHFKDFLKNKSDYSEEDQKAYPEDIQRWTDNGNFVFFWCQDYDIDGQTGDIETS